MITFLSSKPHSSVHTRCGTNPHTSQLSAHTHEPVCCFSCHRNMFILQQLSQGLRVRRKSTHPETTIRKAATPISAAPQQQHRTTRTMCMCVCGKQTNKNPQIILFSVCDQNCLRSLWAPLSCDSPYSAYRCVDPQTPDSHSSSSALTLGRISKEPRKASWEVAF